MKYIECENMGMLGCPRGGEKMNGNWCSMRHIRCIAWNAKRGGCADALEKQRKLFNRLKFFFIDGMVKNI